MQPLSGLIAAPHTPFDADRELALDVVPALARHLAEHGVSGVFVGGTTGEWPALTVAERMRLATAWVPAAREAGLRLVVHVGCLALADARRLAGQAAGVGAEAVASLAPFVQRPSDDEALLDWCAAVAGAAEGLPFFYYDIPGLTGVEPDLPEFLAAACERVPGFAGVKTTRADVSGLEAARARLGERVTLLHGHDEKLVDGLLAGADGAVGSSYNVAGSLSAALCEAVAAGDLMRAHDLQSMNVALIETLAGFDYLPASRALMEGLGVPLGPPRAPLRAVEGSRRAELFAAVEALELTEVAGWPGSLARA